jgi:hypothetical protein
MDSTRHFVVATAASRSRLAALIEEAAAVLDQRGSRRLRTNIVKEAQFALGVLRAIDNAAAGFACGDVPPSNLLDAEIKRLGDLRAGRGLPVTLRVVAGTAFNDGGDDAA